MKYTVYSGSFCQEEGYYLSEKLYKGDEKIWWF